MMVQQELRKLATLKKAAECTIEKWCTYLGADLKDFSNAAREIYAITYDYEYDLREKYGITRSFAGEMEARFGDATIRRLFNN